MLRSASSAQRMDIDHKRLTKRGKPRAGATFYHLAEQESSDRRRHVQLPIQQIKIE